MTDPLSLTAPQLTDALRAAEAEVERLRAQLAGLSNGDAVLANLLLGRIAWPAGLVRRDECRREALEEAATTRPQKPTFGDSASLELQNMNGEDAFWKGWRAGCKAKRAAIRALIDGS